MVTINKNAAMHESSEIWISVCDYVIHLLKALYMHIHLKVSNNFKVTGPYNAVLQDWWWL